MLGLTVCLFVCRIHAWLQVTERAVLAVLVGIFILPCPTSVSLYRE